MRCTVPAKTAPGPYVASAVKGGPMLPSAQTASGMADRAWTLQRLIWVMLRDQTKLGAEDQRALAAIKARSEVVSTAHDLTQAFTLLMRERRPLELEPWFQSAKLSGLSDFVTFARGLERDGCRTPRGPPVALVKRPGRRHRQQDQTDQAAGIWPGFISAPTTVRVDGRVTSHHQK